jgi:hypothetical protein
MMTALSRLLLLPALALAGQAMAAEPAAGERRLSPEEVEKILDAASDRREAAAAAEAEKEKGKLPVHGEVGFTIGTGGYRSAFGTAVVDLPDGGVAAFSFGANRARDWDWNLP